MKKLITFSSYLLLLASVTGCRPYLKDLNGKHREIAKALDHMQWYADAYGFASMSAPLLVEPDPSFRFSPKEATADNFYKSALQSINARSAAASQSTLSIGQSLSASIDILALQNQRRYDSNTNQSDAISKERNRLLFDAADREHQAAMLTAQSIGDPAERLKAEAAAYRALATSLQGLSLSPPASQPGTIPSTAGTGATAASASGLLPPTKPQPLFASDSPSVSNEVRSALLSAAGDTAVSAILSLLGDPSKISKFSDKKVMFGITQVSVNPGWLTSQNFSADISSRIAMDFAPAGQSVYEAFAKASFPNDPIATSAIHDLQKCLAETRNGVKSTLDYNLFEQERFTPFIDGRASSGSLAVAAVSPMEEAQTLDLQNSWQRRREFALQISLALTYAGVRGASDLLSKWASQEQQDVQSRTSNIVVNSYNMNGGIFGFEVGPRLSASLRFDSSSVRRLERQTFPALLMIGFDKEDLRPRVTIEPAKGDSALATCRLVEPRISVRTETNWRPLINARGVVPMTEKELVQIRNESVAAFHSCAPANHKASGACSEPVSELDSMDQTTRSFYEHRWERLRARVTGTAYNFTVPIEAVKESLMISKDIPVAQPVVDAIRPERVSVVAQANRTAIEGSQVQLVVIGKALEKVDLSRIEALTGRVTWVDDKGQTQTSPTAKLVGGAVVLSFRVSGDDPTIVFGLPIDKEKPLTTPPLSVVLLPAKSSTISIDRKQKDGSSETYTFSPDVSDDVKKAVLEKDKPRVVSIKKDETTTTVPAK